MALNNNNITFVNKINQPEWDDGKLQKVKEMLAPFNLDEDTDHLYQMKNIELYNLCKEDYIFNFLNNKKQPSYQQFKKKYVKTFSNDPLMKEAISSIICVAILQVISDSIEADLINLPDPEPDF